MKEIMAPRQVRGFFLTSFTSRRVKNYSKGNRESHTYNENVFRNNLRHAILGQLRAPPEGFHHVTKSHFTSKEIHSSRFVGDKGYLVLHVLYIISQELESQGATYKSKDIQKLLAEVKTELFKIEKPI